MGKELLRVARPTLSELQMDNKQWPDILPLFQSTLNMEPSPQRGNVAPITAFTGLDTSHLLASFIRSDTAEAVTLLEVQREDS